MIADCLALVAAVCLHSSSKVELMRSASGSSAVIQLDSLRVISTFSSDDVQMADASAMSRVCSGKQCFWYSKHCAFEGNLYRCMLYYSLSKGGELKSIEIFADDEASLLAAASSFSLSFDAKDSFNIVNLSENREDFSPPACLKRAGCRSL